MKNEYYVCTDFETAQAVLQGVLNKCPKALAIDLECTGLDEHTGQILGIGFCWKQHTGIYFPINVREIGLFASDLNPLWSADEFERLLELIRKILVHPDIVIVAHNALFEIKWLKEKWDVEPTNTFCTFWYRFIQYPDTSKGYEERLSLGHIVREKYPDLYHLKDIWDSIKSKPKNERDLSLYHSTQRIGEYCCGDCDAAYREYLVDQKDIVGKPFEVLFPRRLMPAVHFTARMTNHGFLVDKDYLYRTRNRLKEEQKTSLLEVQDLVGDLRFNPQSAHHLENLFIRKLRLPGAENRVFDKRMNKMVKKFIFDDTTLTKYYEQHDCAVAEKILTYKRLSKLISTYFDGVEAQINPVTGRVHADFKLWGTVTGRLSCCNPNLQNLPVRDARARIVKNMFIAPEGYVLVGADYSQIELRLLAFYSQDEALMNAFLTGVDVHSLTASFIFGIPIEKITKVQRYIGKRSNFALCYGGEAGVLVYGPAGIGNEIMGPDYAAKYGVEYAQIARLKIDKDVLMRRAREIRAKYFSGYKQLLPYAKHVIAKARHDGYVVSDYGRIRYLPGINDEDERIRVHWEHCAVNSRPQSTASDYLLFHFMDMITEFDARRFGVEPLLPVHDQCVMEVPEDNAEKVCELVPDIGTREDGARITLPMELPAVIGKHLGDV